jgi:hypothetical protein
MLSPFDLHFVLCAFVDIALGALALFFSQDLARGMNRFSVKFYETLPRLKKAAPQSCLGRFSTELHNQHVLLSRAWDAPDVFGALFLGLVLLHRY